MTLVMTYVALAAAVAAIGASPLLIAGLLTGRFLWHLGWYIFIGLCFFIIEAVSFYVFMPASSQPYYGVLPLLVVLTIMAFVLSIRSYEEGDWKLFAGLLMPVLVTAFTIGNWFVYGSIFMNDYKYARLLGPAENRIWTTDIQPLDTERMLLVPTDAAMFNARKRVGELGTLGSQFVLEKENFSLQKIHGRLQHVAPLDFSSFFTWLNTSGVPAYMVIDGHDPNQLTKKVDLDGQKNFFQYMPGAWWTGNLERHLRLSGITHEKFLDRHMELDDNEKPWWVVSLGVPTIWSSGDVVTGIAVVDPATGQFKKYALKEVPAWVDRVIPKDIVYQYLLWNGYYKHGWINALFVGKDLYEPEDVVLQFTQDGRATYVTGTTSTSMKDDSLITLMYTDTRTGKHTRYEMKGGATVSAIRELINNHPDPDLRRAHSGVEHYINAHGTVSVMSPLLVNEVGAYYGVAFIPVMNPDAKKLIRDSDVKNAYKKYLVSLADEGVKIDVVATEKVVVARGRVERLTAPFNDSVGIMVSGVKPILFGSLTEFQALRFTQVGDDVEVSYVETTAESTTLKKFHNFSIPKRGSMMPTFGQ